MGERISSSFHSIHRIELLSYRLLCVASAGPGLRIVLSASASSWLLCDYYFAKGSVSVLGFEPPEGSLTHRLEKRTLGTPKIGPFSVNSYFTWSLRHS